MVLGRLQRVRGVLTAIVLAACVAATPWQLARAATRTWNGGGGDDNWSTGANWGGAAPVTADTLVFAGSARLDNYNDLGLNPNAITFNPDAGAFVLNGNSLTLNGNITDNSPATQTFNLPINLTGARTVNVITGGNLIVSGAISGTNQALTKAGGGTLIFNGSTGNTYGGNTAGTTINDGTLVLDFANMATPTGLIKSSTPLTLGGGVLSILGKNDSDMATTQTLSNVTLTAGTASRIVLDPNGGQDAVLTLGNTWTRNMGSALAIDLSLGGAVMSNRSAASNGVLGFATVTDATGTGLASISGGELVRLTGQSTLAHDSNDAAMNFITTGDIAMDAASFAVNSLTIDAATGAGSLDLGGAADVMAIASKGIFMSGGSDYTIRNGQLGANATEVIVHQLGAGTLTIDATISDGGAGGLTKTGTGTLVVNSTNAYTGGTMVYGGMLRVGSDSALGATTGALTVGAGAAFDLNGHDVAVGKPTISGTIDNSAASTDSVLTIGNGFTGTGGAGATIGGLIQNSGGTLAIVKNGAGDITLGNNDNTYSGGTTVNGGTILIGTGAAGTAVSGGVIVSGPFGTGAVTFNDGSKLGFRTNGITLANDLVTSGAVTLDGTGASYALIIDQAGIASPHGLTLAGDTTLTNNNTAVTVNSNISGNYNLTLRKTGSSGSYTFNGAIGNGGDLVLDGASAIVVNGGIGGTVKNVYNTGFAVINGVIATDVSHVYQNSTVCLQLNTATDYAGGITANSGIVWARNTTTTSPPNELKSLGTGTIALENSVLVLQANGSGNNKSIITGDGATGNDLVVGGYAGNPVSIQVDRYSATVGGTFVFNNLSIGNNVLFILGRNSYGLRFDGATTLTGNAIFNPHTAPLTLAGLVEEPAGGSGSGLTMSGLNRLILTGSNTYTGQTAVYSGVLQASDNAGLPGASSAGGGSNLLLNGGVLQSNGAASFTRGLGTGPTEVRFGAAGGGFAANGGLLTVNLGNNVPADTLAFGDVNFLAAGAPLLLGSSTASNTVDFQNPLDLKGGEQTIYVTDNTGSTADVNRISGAISDSLGGGSLTKEGDGPLFLSAPNGYAGATIVKSGTLRIEAANGSLNSATTLTFSGTGTFNYDNTGAAEARAQTVGTLTFSAGDGTAQTNRAAAQDVELTFTSLAPRAAGATANFVSGGAAAGTANGTNVSIVLKDGDGGSHAAGFIDQGTFFGGNNFAWYDAASGDGFVRGIQYGSDAGAVVTSDGLPLAGTYVKTTVGVTGQTTATFATLHIENTTTTAQAFTLASGATLTVNGILRSGNGNSTTTISGDTAIRAATNAELILRADLANDKLTINTPIVANGANNLVKTGAGTVTLGATNTYAGTTYLNAGTLTANAVGAIPGNLVINAGTFNVGTLGGNHFAAAEPRTSVTMYAGSFTIGSNAAEVIADYTQYGGNGKCDANNPASTLTVNGTTTIAGGSFYLAGNSGTKWTTNKLVISGGNMQIDTRSNQGPIEMNVGAGGYEIRQPAAGVFVPLIFTTDNNQTSVNPRLNLSGNLTYLPNASNSHTSYITTSGTKLAQGAINLSAGAHTFDIGHTVATAADLVIQSSIIGGGIIKTGAGTLQLDFANGYSGGTSVEAGTLLVTNTARSATGSGTVAVGNLTTTGLTPTLAGNGLISGAVTVYGPSVFGSAGRVAPGVAGSVGTLTIGGLTLSDGSIFNLDGDASGLDLIDVAGADLLTLADFGSTTVNLTNLGGLTTGTAYQFLKYQGSPVDITDKFSAGTIPAGFTGMTFGVQTVGTDNYVNLMLTSAGVLPGSGTWTNGALSHMWTTSDNWKTGQPQAAGHVATFDDTALANTTAAVDLGADGQTIGKLLLDTSTGGYTIGTADSPPLTLNNTDGDGGAAAITAEAGTHTIAAQVVTEATALEVVTTGTASLALTGGIDNSAAMDLALNGTGALLSVADIVNAGTMTVSGAVAVGNVSGAGETIVNGILTADSLRQDGLVINAGAMMTINATSGPPSTTVDFLEICSPATGGSPLAGAGAVEPVPEPAAWLLAVMAALAGLIAWRRQCRFN